jgi:hypothetical protein
VKKPNIGCGHEDAQGHGDVSVCGIDEYGLGIYYCRQCLLEQNKYLLYCLQVSSKVIKDMVDART